MGSQTQRSGSFTRGGAIAAILVILLAVPVAAEVAIQNFMAADVLTSDACFSKTAGSDAASASGFFTFDSSTTVTDGGVDLIQETSTIRAFAGDRLLYSDAIVFSNTCGADITVSFISAPDPAGNPAVDPAAGGVWDDLNLSFYLEDPAGVTVPGLAGTWVEMLTVTGGAISTPGSVVIPDGQNRPMAVTVDTDGAATAGSTGTLRWIAAANHG